MAWLRVVTGGRAVVVASAMALATVATPAAAQQTAPASRPGTEWFREEAPAAPVAAQQAPGMQAQPAAPAPAAIPPIAAPVAPAAPAAPAPPPLRPYQMPPPGNYYSGYGSSSGLYPSYEMNNYVVASGRASMARALYRQAESELGAAYRAAQRQFENSADYKHALKDERDAWESMQATRAKALEVLANDTKYNRLLALREDLTRQLEAGRVRKNLSQDEIVAMATLKMSYAAELRAIEANVLKDDSTVREAQSRLITAGTRVSALRQAYDEAVRSNPDILMARQNMADAVVARQTADAYLRAATVNGAAALDYAYYLYRTPTRGNDYYGYRY